MSTLPKLNSVQKGLSLLGGSLLMVSMLGGAKAQAQTPESATPFKSALSDATLLAQTETIPPLRYRLDRVASIAPVRGGVTVTLRNNSPSDITYEAVAATSPRTLATGEEAVLTGLDTPTTIVFYEKDGGLTQATISEVSRRNDSFMVEFNQAPTLSEDDNSVVILESGNIYFM